MEEAFKSGLMGPDMKVSGRTTKLTEEEGLFMQMATFMRGNG